MRNILVTAISGDVANGILKILQNTEDNVFGCDVYDYPVGMDRVVKWWKIDFASDENYIPNLISKCIENNITHIIPVNEKEISEIKKNIDLFQRKNIKVVINDGKIIDTFLDKYLTYKYLSDIKGVNVPKTFEIDEYVEDGREYILKLRNACGSKYIRKISSREELSDLPYPEGEFILQEYLPDEGQEYTVGVFSDGENVNTIIFRRKLKDGYSAFVEYVEDDTISNMAIQIAHNIKLKGYINIQLRKKRGLNYIFEINPRISGTVVFRDMLGFRDVIWWLDLTDGKRVPEYEKKWKRAIGIRELNEKYVVQEEK